MPELLRKHTWATCICGYRSTLKNMTQLYLNDNTQTSYQSTASLAAQEKLLLLSSCQLIIPRVPIKLRHGLSKHRKEGGMSPLPFISNFLWRADDHSIPQDMICSMASQRTISFHWYSDMGTNLISFTDGFTRHPQLLWHGIFHFEAGQLGLLLTFPPTKNHCAQ